MMSGGVPAPVGTTMRMMPEGKVCCAAQLSEPAERANADTPKMMPRGQDMDVLLKWLAGMASEACSLLV